ncbi:MAG: hypothetical protein DRR19_00870 [Candidatus Parabeggiatoa sp. nov. 1]|nr:MAG: hypothetical protein DRR19_00870 [Gammaproteobacteria bacterium]
MQIEIAEEITIRHFYGHDEVTEPVVRAALEREADNLGKNIEKDTGVTAQPHLITKDKGIRVFVPNLAVGETYWVVLELEVPKGQSDFGKATIQYFDTFKQENSKKTFSLSPNGQLAPQLVAQHALSLWTSEEVYDALDDVEANDITTLEQRMQIHLSVLESAKSHLAPKMPGRLKTANPLMDDIITLGKFVSLAKALIREKNAPQARSYLIHGLRERRGVRNGLMRVDYDEQ